ncbi:MAG: NAD+ synthase [Candidatus Mesenet longicola]|uniref:Glutamine-dependent NAD(+) synthetase n=1 Tax=Candidatus Mesenet longicola TaxID=1892558 RepID=A0A8J3HUW6_9RICK|nr:MAG: NAD+ synthase [Candidatus Mesenet longicola]GHM59535.1 MAG: NAD+ synthase [Candidatus Mesenet longicola]
MNLILISQLNYIAENVQHNSEKIFDAYKKNANNAVELAIFSSFAISGYLRKPPVPINGFFERCNEVLEELAQYAKNYNVPIIIGSATEKQNKIFNSIFLLQKGIILLLAESNLKNNKIHEFTFNEEKIKLYILNTDLENDLIEEGAGSSDILLFMDSRPYTKGKKSSIEKFYHNGKKIIYVNQIGGNDEYVFSGGSFVKYIKGINFLSNWQEESKLINLKRTDQFYTRSNVDYIEDIYQALMLGLRDYVAKNNFDKVILGLSGGIDSALVAIIACDALGSAKVRSFMLQSEYTSAESIQDAQEFASRVNISHEMLSISTIFDSIKESLKEIFVGYHSDITEENIQARIRGMILMAVSNKFGGMLLATGNKSEMSVGYATIYGDMCGGFAPIKDIYKTEVYELAKWRNDNIPENSLCCKINVIPQSIIDKPPSAELRHNQMDQDTLPDYNILDSILKMLLDEKETDEFILKKGYDIRTVNYIIKLIKRAKYKRLQSPLGPKL